MSGETGTRSTVFVRRAGPGDVGPIMAIERACFPSPWPPGTISGDLRHPQAALYLLAEFDGKPAAYLGGWVYDVEFHLGSVATDAAHRGQGLAEILVLAALRHAAQTGLERTILEYRVSNLAAAALYNKIGFQKLRLRKHYYADNLEDAIEAKMGDLQAPETLTMLEEKLQAWQAQRGHELQLAEL